MEHFWKAYSQVLITLMLFSSLSTLGMCLSDISVSWPCMMKVQIYFRALLNFELVSIPHVLFFKGEHL